MFVPYICCGDPDISFTKELALALEPYCSVLEIGIPFSDPIADGPTIQAASQRALLNKINQKSAFELVKYLRENKFSKPIAFMAYYNTLYSFGCEKFLASMKECGSDSIIIPDLPLGEDPDFEKMCQDFGISKILLISPSTPPGRAKEIADASCSHFLYLVSRKGITGAGGEISPESIEFVKKTRGLAPGKKLCVGFGVSTPKQAGQFIAAGADGVIVGSRIIDIYSKYLVQGRITQKEKAISEVLDFAKSFKNAQK